MFCRADWDTCASKGVVEKSVAMFKRAAGGWVEYGRYLGLWQTLCLVRGTEENKRLEDSLDTIRILCETVYDKNHGEDTSLVLTFMVRKTGPRIAVPVLP